MKVLQKLYIIKSYLITLKMIFIYNLQSPIIILIYTTDYIVKRCHPLSR